MQAMQAIKLPFLQDLYISEDKVADLTHGASDAFTFRSCPVSAMNVGSGACARCTSAG